MNEASPAAFPTQSEFANHTPGQRTALAAGVEAVRHGGVAVLLLALS